MKFEGTFNGRCWKFGDNVPTDEIVSSHRVFLPLEEMAKHVLENLDPRFPVEVAAGDIVVAGRHFGQSSGRAIAAKALRATGIGCVVAESFARTFYRNSFEVGLPILECPGIASHVAGGDLLSVDLSTGVVVNQTTGARYDGERPDPFLLRMLAAGGLIPLARELAPEWEAVEDIHDAPGLG